MPDWFADAAMPKFNYDKASADLSLTPQEQFLYTHHLRNLTGKGKVVQPSGETSTMLQAVVTGPDDRFYNIPTVWDGKALPVEKAIEKAKAVGLQNFPSYESPEAADARYEKMHDYFEKDTQEFMSKKK